MKVYRHILELREENNLKQKDMVKILNVAQNTYSQYETGVIALTADVLERLADYYHVSVDYLLDRTDVRDLHKKRQSRRKNEKV